MKLGTIVRRCGVALGLVLFGLVLLGLLRTQGEGGQPPAPAQWRRVR